MILYLQYFVYLYAWLPSFWMFLVDTEALYAPPIFPFSKELSYPQLQVL